MTTLKNVRLAATLAVSLAIACGAPDVGQSAPVAPSAAAVFDPTTNAIPLPNDLALAQIPPTLPAAQQDLLRAFQAQGGFPNDQEVPVTISFQTTTVQGGTASDPAATAPDLDFKTFNAGTLVAFLQTAQGAGTVALDPIQPTDYVKNGSVGTLTLHNKGRGPWTPGHYIFALRGGPSGIKITSGTGIVAAPTFFLIAQGAQLNTEANLALLRAQLGSNAAALAAAAQLQPIIDQYKNGGVFAAVDRVFPHQEAAVITTFAIAPIAGTQVQLDAGRGIVPLPIDLLRDPRPASASCAACGKLTPVAACTFAQGTLNAQGVCLDSKGNPNPAAGGFAALDGFSTTGFILSPTSDLIQASTVNATTVKIFDLTHASPPACTAPPCLLDPSTYITEPVEVTQSGLSPVIALQPAGATADDPTSVFRTRPLQDNSDYAVVISDGVHDKTGKAIVPGTVAKILQFTNPVADTNGKSQLTGIDDATASGLEAMRAKLGSVLRSGQVDRSHVAMAFTFHTQTILSTGAQLGALPYQIVKAVPAKGAPGAVAHLAAAAAFSKYGADAAVIPNANIAEVIETTITTFNLLDNLTGAFNPAGTTADETINVMIARPSAANVNLTNCSGQLAAFGALGIKCSPMVIFRHGLGGGRANMLQVADTFNAKGFTVVAIDAAKHGDRSFCTGNTTRITIGGVANVQQCGSLLAAPQPCTTLLPVGAQGDGANPPGTCAPAQFTYLPVSRTCLANPGVSCGWTGQAGIPTISSNYLVTSNFFRTRDTLRQDIIDESQATQAIAFVPSTPPPTGNTVFDYMASKGVIIDPTQVFFVGQSLGAIQGTVDVATNPRISRAVLNVGGGTIVDVFTNSPAFTATTNALLASLGIQPGANSAFLQFLVVAKTVLDPADPVNFAGHIQANTLPNLLANPNGSVAQAPKAVLTQAAFCDQTVPNPFNFILDSTMGTGPLPGFPGFPGGGTFQVFSHGGAPDLTACPSPTSGLAPPATAAPHAFFTDWSIPALTAGGQTDAANFLTNPTPLPNVRVF
jgi:hypothetical protein